MPLSEAEWASASELRLPPGSWGTVLDCLISHFSTIAREVWLERMQRGRVLDANRCAIGPDHPYRAGLAVHYFREIANEPRIPFREELIHVDDHLVVADKPHFLPVTPAGRFVRETLLARLRARLANPDLVPLHRIDRGTAGLVMFSAQRATRADYQALFRERRIDKLYAAIAPALPGLTFPHSRESRIVKGVPFFRMQEVEGMANARTGVEVLADEGKYWRYALRPATGKTHQLRVHMAALGAAIVNDRLYPLLLDEQPDDFSLPLKLLAKSLTFIDPLSGEPRHFVSRLAL